MFLYFLLSRHNLIIMCHNFNLVIPSYNRSKLIKEKTLKFIIDNKLNNKNTVYVFTPQLEEYKKELKDIENLCIVKSDIGLNNSRNYIMKYFKLNTKLLILDDDIDTIINLNCKEPSIISEIIRTFEFMETEKIKLGSINPTSNSYFSDKKIKIGYYFCIGTIYFLINDKFYLNINDELEDYTRTILYYKRYGKILRNNNLLLKTKYNQKGGMFSIERNNERSKHAINLFLDYPEYVLLKKKKDYLGIKLLINKKNIIIDLNKDVINEPNNILGSYPNINYKDNFKLLLNKNYIFKVNNKIEGYLIRDIYKLNNIENLKIKTNQNSGDIAGKLDINKIQNCSKKYFNEFKFNKNKTRTKKDEKHKFELSNTIKRLSEKIKDNEKINNIYNQIKNYNVLNECNYYSCNKELVSAYHKDKNNKSNYVMLLTKNNNLDLHLPELNLKINNKDNDLLIFNLKEYIHGNTIGNINNRYSLIFFDKKIKEEK